MSSVAPSSSASNVNSGGFLPEFPFVSKLDPSLVTGEQLKLLMRYYDACVACASVAGKDSASSSEVSARTRASRRRRRRRSSRAEVGELEVDRRTSVAAEDVPAAEEVDVGVSVGCLLDMPSEVLDEVGLYRLGRVDAGLAVGYTAVGPRVVDALAAACARWCVKGVCGPGTVGQAVTGREIPPSLALRPLDLSVLIFGLGLSHGWTGKEVVGSLDVSSLSGQCYRLMVPALSLGQWPSLIMLISLSVADVVGMAELQELELVPVGAAALHMQHRVAGSGGVPLLQVLALVSRRAVRNGFVPACGTVAELVVRIACHGGAECPLTTLVGGEQASVPAEQFANFGLPDTQFEYLALVKLRYRTVAKKVLQSWPTLGALLLMPNRWYSPDAVAAACVLGVGTTEWAWSSDRGLPLRRALAFAVRADEKFSDLTPVDDVLLAHVAKWGCDGDGGSEWPGVGDTVGLVRVVESSVACAELSGLDSRLTARKCRLDRCGYTCGELCRQWHVDWHSACRRVANLQSAARSRAKARAEMHYSRVVALAQAAVCTPQCWEAQREVQELRVQLRESREECSALRTTLHAAVGVGGGVSPALQAVLRRELSRETCRLLASTAAASATEVEQSVEL